MAIKGKPIYIERERKRKAIIVWIMFLMTIFQIPIYSVLTLILLSIAYWMSGMKTRRRVLLYYNISNYRERKTRTFLISVIVPKRSLLTCKTIIIRTLSRFSCHLMSLFCVIKFFHDYIPIIPTASLLPIQYCSKRWSDNCISFYYHKNI